MDKIDRVSQKSLKVVFSAANHNEERRESMKLLKSIFDELNVDFHEDTGVNMNDALKSIRRTVLTDLLDNGQSSKGIIESSLETMNRMAPTYFYIFLFICFYKYIFL